MTDLFPKQTSFIASKVLEPCFLKMGQDTGDSGRTGKWKEKVNIIGVTKFINTLDNIKTV